MNLTNKELVRFSSDPRLIAAQQKLYISLKRVQKNIRDDAPAEYYLQVLPVLIQMLAEADYELTAVKNDLYTEIIKERSERNEVSGPGGGEGV